MSDWTMAQTRTDETYASLGRTINQAFYGQDQMRLAERLTVVVGGRYDYWRTYDGFSNTFDGDDAFSSYPERTNNSLTGKLSAVYAANRGWTFRASVGSAFRNPTVYELYRTFRLSSGTNYIANPSLKPERLLSTEAGVSKRIGNGFEFDANYYRNHVSDLIYRKTDFDADPNGFIRVLVNAGKSKTDGVETSVRQRLTSWLQLRGSYTYTRALITENPAVPATEGMYVPYIPQHVFSSSLLAARRRWTGSATFRYTGAVFTSDTNTDTTKGVMGSYSPYGSADASLGYHVSRNVQVFASVENLLDRQYYLFYLNPGRTVSVGIRIKVNP